MFGRAEETRFAFGENWARFLTGLDEKAICAAQQSLTTMLECDDLTGKSFLDIGSGSGLFSLAARRLGARVHSFDRDPQSVACTAELKRRYFPDDPYWAVEQGSVLDRAYLKGLGTFDVVYAWGVLHHTGAMWQACECVADLVAPGGMLLLAIYNDQGRASRSWLFVKRWYNALPRPFRFLVLWPAFVRLWGPTTLPIAPSAGLFGPGARISMSAACRRGGTWWTGWAAIRLKLPNRKRCSTSFGLGGLR